MHVTNLEVLNAAEAVNELVTLKLPGSLAFKVGMIAKFASTTQEAFFAAQGQIIDRLSSKDEDGNPVTKDGIVDFGKNNDEAMQERNELLGLSSEFPDNMRISFGDISKIDSISPISILALGKFVDSEG